MESPSNTLRIILTITVIPAMFAIAAYMESPASILRIILAIIIMPAAFAMTAPIVILKGKRKIRKKQQKLSMLLDERALKDVLAAAPYAYGHWQGENGFRIWDKRIKDGSIHFTQSQLDAELWIVEKYLSKSAVPEPSQLTSRIEQNRNE